MPGALLPAFLLRWHLTDERGGVLLFSCAIGSGLGALLSLRNFRATILLASACISGAALLWALPLRYPDPAGLLWGIGLGMLMTSISLLHQQSPDGTTALIRLNFTWALGAFFCAPLMTHALRASSPRGVLLSFAMVFLLYAGGSLFLLSAHRQALPGRLRARAFDLRGIPPGLMLGCALTVAVESACGGWLSTYATRERDTLFAIVAAPTCLWAGLLLSRAVSWLPRAPGLLGRTLSLQVALVVTSAAFMLLSHTAVPLLFASFCMGFGLGPLYPLMLDTVLRRRQTGAVFMFPGIAGSLLPWLTGLASSHAGSLRRGFLVVLVAAIALAVFIHRYRRELLTRPA